MPVWPKFQLSRDGCLLAHQESSSSKVFVNDLRKNQIYCLSPNENITSFCFSYNSEYLALTNNTPGGNVQIYNVNTQKLVENYQNLTGNNEHLVASVFHYEKEKSVNCLVVADSQGNIYVSNIDKGLQKYRFFDRNSIFVENSSNSDSINDLLNTYDGQNTIIIVLNQKFLLFNILTGKSGLKSNHNPIPCIMDSKNLVTSSYKDQNLLAQVDEHTIISFNNKKKYGKKEPLNNSFDISFKKRFSGNIRYSQAIFDKSVIAIEENGVLSICQSEKKVIKIRFLGTPEKSKSGQVTHQASNPKRRKEIERSKILFAATVLDSQIVIGYGDSLREMKIYKHDYDKFMSLVSKRQINLRISDLEKSKDNFDSQNNTESSNSNNNQSIQASIKSTAAYEELSDHKRKYQTGDIQKPKTIGETLEERLEAENKITQELDQQTIGEKNNEPDEDILLSSSDKSISLVQSLQSQNDEAVNFILLEAIKNPEMINTTLKNISKSYLSSLLHHLRNAIFMKNRYDLSSISIDWLNHLLKLYPAHIMNDASVYRSLISIHGISSDLNKYQNMMNKLNGKLNYFIENNENEKEHGGTKQTMQYQSIYQKMQSSLNEQNKIQPQFIYEADHDNTSTSESVNNSDNSSDVSDDFDEMADDFDNDDDDMQSFEEEEDSVDEDDNQNSEGDMVDESEDEEGDPNNNQTEDSPVTQKLKRSRMEKNKIAL